MEQNNSIELSGYLFNNIYHKNDPELVQNVKHARCSMFSDPRVFSGLDRLHYVSTVVLLGILGSVDDGVPLMGSRVLWISWVQMSHRKSGKSQNARM